MTAATFTAFLSHQFHEHKALLILLIIGMVAGLLAQMILPGRGFGMLSTIVIGVLGAWLGNNYIKSHITFINDSLLKEIVAATAGAMILCMVINIIRGGEERDKTHWRHN